MFQTFKSHPKIPMMRFGVLGPGGPEPPMAVASSSKTLKAGMWHLERQLMSTTDVEKTCRRKCRLTVKSEINRGVGGRCHLHKMAMVMPFWLKEPRHHLV